MATRPSQLPTWATDTNYSSGPESGTPTKTEPSAGLKASGYHPAAVPTAQEFGWQLNLIYLWLQYLDLNDPETKTIHVPLTGPSSAGPLDDVGVSSGSAWWVGIPVPAGRTITAVRARCLPGSSTTGRVSIVEVADGVPTTTSVGTSSGAGVQTIDSGAISIPVVANKMYEAKFDLSAGVALTHFYSLEVDHKAT